MFLNISLSLSLSLNGPPPNIPSSPTISSKAGGDLGRRHCLLRRTQPKSPKQQTLTPPKIPSKPKSCLIFFLILTKRLD